VSLREQLRANAQAERFYSAAMPSDKPPAPVPVLEHREPPAAARRAPRTPSGEPPEREIRKDIVRTIRTRPDCAFVGEFNRGTAVEHVTSYAGGAYRTPVTRYIRFNSVPGFPDIHGLLRNGKAFYLEVKRAHHGRLEPDQRDFLFLARQAGAIAGVVTSVEEAHALIDAFL
jgi:hypothetical protein